jgi:hypothetical protein
MVKVLRLVSLEKRKAALPEMGSNGREMGGEFQSDRAPRERRVRVSKV